MKIFKLFLASGIGMGALFLTFTTHLTSCTKETIRDTTTVIIHDTIIREYTDTIVKMDTVCLGLVAHYNFTGGSLLDETENHNDIIFNNATAAADIDGAANNAYLFDGSSSYMKVPNSTSLNPQEITLMARVKVNDFYMGTCHFSDIISKGATDEVNGFYVLRIADPYGRCYELPDITKEFFVGNFGNNIPQGSAAGVASDTSFIQKGGWYTAVFTFNGNESRMYVNGVLKAVNENTTSFTGNDDDLYIGRHEDSNFPYWFNGVIDEIRIYDRAVSPHEVQVISSN